MKINVFRGELTDSSAKNEALVLYMMLFDEQPSTVLHQTRIATLYDKLYFPSMCSLDSCIVSTYAIDRCRDF